MQSLHKTIVLNFRLNEFGLTGRQQPKYNSYSKMMSFYLKTITP